MIYLDNAATSWPKPEAVYESLGNFLRTSGANPGRAGHKMAIAAAEAIADTRHLLATLLNAETDDRVIFTANATDALNLAIRGLVHPDDHVITSSLEHNSVSRPIRMAEHHGATATIVPGTPDGYLDPEAVRAAITPRTRLIAITHASNVTGAVTPIQEIARIAREHDILLLVDGAQTVGAMPVDVQALGIDLLAFPGHKGLLGPTGTGGLYIGPRVSLDQFEPLRSGGTGVYSEDSEQPMLLPYRYEAGTVNTSGIAALGAGIRYVLDRGVAEISHYENHLMDELRTGIAEVDHVRVFPIPTGTTGAAVLSFTIDGWSPGDAGAVLDESFDIACRVGLHCAPQMIETIGAPPTGTIRFSPGPFTTPEEIAKAVAAVRELAESPLS